MIAGNKVDTYYASEKVDKKGSYSYRRWFTDWLFLRPLIPGSTESRGSANS